MKVCEACCAEGYTERIYHGQPIKVLCDTCLGARSICLGPEGFTRWRQQRAEAITTAMREGWYEVVWDGEPGDARKVLKRIGATSAERRTA